MKTLAFALLTGLLSVPPAFAVSVGQIDTFEDGTALNWQKGSLIDPSFDTINQATGGPNGLNDHYLSSISHGGGGEFNAGKRQILFNTSQWTGNYLSAGISAIKMDLQSFDDLNFSNDLAIRIAVRGASGTRYGSGTAFNLAVDGQWHSFTFDLSDLVLISGTDSLADVLSSVDTLRILSAANGPTWQGDTIESFLGVDNISAVPLPAAAWLFISAFISLVGFRKTNNLQRVLFQK